MNLKQINVGIPEELARRVKMDAVRLEVPLNVYTSRALAKFIERPIEHRRASVAGSRRIAGRRPAI